jgi:hypothetical protein
VPEAVSGKRVTERGIEIIRLVLRYRFLSTGTLVRLVGGNEDVTHRHLQQLYHQEIVSRFTLPRSGSRGEFIYFLENASALRELAHRLGPDPIDWAQIKGNREKYGSMAISENGDGYGKFLFIRHELMISDFHASVELACRASDGRVELARWAQGAELWSSVRMPSRRSLPHRPDAFFTLRFPLAPEGQQKCNFFYEADRATTNLTRLRQKFEAHFEFLNQGKQKALQIKRIRAVLVETITEERSLNYRELVARLAAKEPLAGQMFWFSVEPEFKLREAFEPVWHLASAPRPRCLLD